MSSAKPVKAKPAVCMLGPYSSGKTFLVNYLLKEPLFSSEVEPVTAVITVIRHVEDKPADWPSDCNVFVLKNKSDLHTLDFGCTKGSYNYADLSRLTTYSASLRHDAVVVFVDKDILRRCTLLDCPGVGNMSEAVLDDAQDETPDRPTQRSLTRERELQNRAIASADAFVMLSSLAGGNGGLADSNTANILFAIAAHMTAAPTIVPHGNILVVGSMADPGKQDLEDEESVLTSLQAALQQQVEKLPPEQRKKFDSAGLKRRIVLFFALDSRQRHIALHRAKLEIKRYTPTVDETELTQKAQERLDELRLTRERTAAFEAALSTTLDQVQLATGRYLGQSLKTLLDTGLTHFADIRTRNAPQLGHRHYEALSGRYDAEATSREKAWKAVVTSFESDVNRSATAINHDLERALKHWANQDNVSKLLDKEFRGDKARAQAQALRHVCDHISSEVGESLRRHATSPRDSARQQVEAFDRMWLERGAVSDRASRPADLPAMMKPASSPETLEHVSTCLSSIASKSPLAPADAQAPPRALLGAAAGFGATAVISGGNWVLCWLVAVAVGTLAYLWPHLVWRSTLSGTIATWVAQHRPTIAGEVRKLVDADLSVIRSIGHKSLEETRALLAAHVLDVHELGKSKVSYDHLKQASGFYDSHIAALQKMYAETAVLARGDPV